VSDRNLFTVAKVLMALYVLLLGATSALGYAGPGADIAFVSYAMALVAWALAAFSAIVLWPVYALLRKVRGAKKESTTTSPLEKTPEEARSATS
jgi:cyanate permease